MSRSSAKLLLSLIRLVTLGPSCYQCVCLSVCLSVFPSKHIDFRMAGRREGRAEVEQFYIFLLFGTKNGLGWRRVGRGQGASRLALPREVKMLSLRLLCSESSEFSGARQTNLGPDRSEGPKHTLVHAFEHSVHAGCLAGLHAELDRVGLGWAGLVGWGWCDSWGWIFWFSIITTTASPTTTLWEFSVNPFCGKSRFFYYGPLIVWLNP